VWSGSRTIPRHGDRAAWKLLARFASRDGEGVEKPRDMLRVLHLVVDAQVLVGRVDSRAGVSEAGGCDRDAQRFDEGVGRSRSSLSNRVPSRHVLFETRLLARRAQQS